MLIHALPPASSPASPPASFPASFQLPSPAAYFGSALPVCTALPYRSTNSSYGRWDEARKMWGLVVNRSRDLTRQALGYIPAHQAELQSMLCRWVVAYR